VNSIEATTFVDLAASWPTTIRDRHAHPTVIGIELVVERVDSVKIVNRSRQYRFGERHDEANLVDSVPDRSLWSVL
jgi:hypothetical protein